MNRMITTKKHPKCRSAFTLVEMILAIGIVSVIGLAVTGMVYASYQNWELTSRRSNVLQDGQAAMEQMIRILRQAKGFSAVTESTDEAGYVTFTSVDNIIEEFRLNTATSELEYGQPGALSALAGPVSRLVFTSYDTNENVLTGAVQLSSIQAVNIEATLVDAEDSSISITLSGRVFIPTDVENPCLVGRWKLDETLGLTAADSSGSGNDGTLTNMIGNEWTTGILGGGLDFDGLNDSVEVPDDPGFDIPNEITVAAWINPGDASAWRTILSKFASGARKDIYWYLYGGRIGIALAGPRDNDWTTSITIPTGNWIHVAATYDGSCIRMYKNAVNEDTLSGLSGAVMLADSSSDQSFYIGKNTVWGEYFDGTIDDVRIYSCALNDEEVFQLASILRYREFTEAKAASDTTSITISTPAGTQENDLLIAAVATDGDTASSLSPPGGEGWTQINIVAYSNDVTLGAWWKNADASESASHQFTWSGAEQAYGWMMRFTGHDTSDPIDDSAGDGGSSSTPTSPEVTTTNDNSLILRMGVFDDSDITKDAPGLAGHTAITMDKTASSPIVGWWKLDESSGLTAADSSSNGSNGTLENMAGNEWTTGQIDGALEFDGSNDFVEVPDDPIFDIADEITVTAWINPVDSSAWRTILSKFASGARKDIYWYLYGGRIGIALAGPRDNDWTTSITIPTGNWIHVAATYDGSCIRMYKNAVNEDTLSGLSGAVMLADSSSDQSFYIGKNTVWGEYFRGTIDDVRIYDRVLADGEISEVMAGGGGSVSSSEGSVSGGAGYVRQSNSGDSGTSTFSLTASEESRTLTIAISPAP